MHDSQDVIKAKKRLIIATDYLRKETDDLPECAQPARSKISHLYEAVASAERELKEAQKASKKSESDQPVLAAQPAFA